MSADATHDPSAQQDGHARQSSQQSLTSGSFEASLDPRAGDLLSLPFDQYGRMRIAQNILNSLYEGIIGLAAQQQSENSNATADLAPPEGQQSARLEVLDVGGYPGILRHFATPSELYDITVLDVVPDNGSIPGYIQGSGLDLPFPDDSFDVVTALDTLEHIPNPNRERFLSELMRVARHGLVLINPVQSIETDVAEETLDEYIRWILDAQQEQLQEHRTFGLPDFGATEQGLLRGGWQTAAFSAANVYNWLLMMVAKHYLLSLRDEKAGQFERTLDRFYNLTFSDSDRSQPAYRGVLIAVRPGLEGVLRQVETAYPPVASSEGANTERLQLTQVLMTLLDLKTANHEDRLLREQMEARDQHISQLQQRMAILDIQLDRANHELTQLDEYRSSVAAKDQHIANLTSRLENEVRSKDEHILYLEKLLQGIESGRVLRLTRKVSRLLGRG